ncbi:MAG: Trm112 family protein [Planctomycetota bacterium]|nr:MAG: Trm112 family protein [Planctomycetota bacterium]
MGESKSRQKLEDLMKILVCPICKTRLLLEDEKIVCTKCGRRYPILEGDIPDLLPESGVLPEDAESAQ